MIENTDKLCFHYENEDGFLPGEYRPFFCNKIVIGRFVLIMQMDFGKVLELTEVEVFGQSNSDKCKILKFC